MKRFICSLGFKKAFLWHVLFVLWCGNAAAVPIVFESSADFGDVIQGEAKLLTITLKNKNRKQVRLDEYWFEDSNNYTYQGGTCKFNGFVLKAKQKCTFNLQFQADYLGESFDKLVIGYFKGTGWRWVESRLSLKGNGIQDIQISETTPAPAPAPASAKGQLSVVGNRIVDANGNTVILKGVNIADPEHLNTKPNERPGVSADSVAKMAVTDYFVKVVRLPILPGDPKYPSEGWFGSQNGGQKYFDNHLDPLVTFLTSKKIYVIIDLHYVSNYTGLFSKVSEFWNFIAPKYKDNPYVIYEMMNEPIFPNNWDQFKEEIAAPVVKIIRSHAPENLIIVGSPYWSSNLQGIVENPIESKNIVYSAHIYSNQKESTWEPNYGEVIKTYPVMITEWGFETGGTEGGDNNYGTKFESWMSSHNLSWTAWCFDNLWGPRMFDENWNLLGGTGGMGEFIKQKLIENNK